MAGAAHVLLPDREPFAGGDADLLLHDVDAGDHFGHRVFDLEARVRLHEVEPSFGIHQELEGARVGVLDCPGGRHDQAAHPAADRVRERRRLLEQLLMPPLDGALALTEMHDVAVLVGQDLELDVAGMLEVFLDVDVAVPEGGLRLAPRHPQRAAQIRRRSDDAHAAATPAGHRLDDDGVADGAGHRDRDLLALHGAVAARQHRQARLLHRLARARLVPEQLDDPGLRADERDLARLADLGKVRAFGNKPITGMDRVGSRDLCRADDRRHVEVAVAAGCRSDADVLVSEADVQRVLVRLQ